MSTLTNINLCKISYAAIRKAMRGENYQMTLKSKGEIDAIVNAVNQGIDSHLEACSIKGKDTYELTENKIGKVTIGQMLVCEVTPKSLPTLLRRMFESDDEESESLASDILTTLGFNDLGKFVGRKALGLD